MNIAIIPARGGSKRIPKKNIKLFNDMPIIYWSIQAAVSSKVFDHIFVSTDCDEISSISKKYGAKVPFIRSKSLADDFTGTAEVIIDAISNIQKLGFEFENVCCIYPTSPLIMPKDILDSLKILNNKCVDFVYPVAEYSHPIHRSMKIKENGKMEFLFKENQLTRTQDLPKMYHDAAQFYWGKTKAWLDKKKMHSGHGYVIPNWRTVDIDNHEDWERAEILFKIIKQ